MYPASENLEAFQQYHNSLFKFHTSPKRFTNSWKVQSNSNHEADSLVNLGIDFLLRHSISISLQIHLFLRSWNTDEIEYNTIQLLSFTVWFYYPTGDPIPQVFLPSTFIHLYIFFSSVEQICRYLNSWIGPILNRRFFFKFRDPLQVCRKKNLT